MNDAKYIGLDVHQAAISAAVLDSTGKLVMESILETKAATILQFFQGLRGSLFMDCPQILSRFFLGSHPRTIDEIDRLLEVASRYFRCRDAR